MRCAAAAEFCEGGAKQVRSECPISPNWGDDQVFDEAAGPALDEADGLAVGSGYDDQSGVELFVFDKRPPPAVEVAGRTAAGCIGGAEEGVEFDRARLVERRDGYAIGERRQCHRRIQHFPQADVVSQKKLFRGYGLEAAVLFDEADDLIEAFAA